MNQEWTPEHWRPPSPYVTHQDLHPLQREIGSLGSGQTTLRQDVTGLQGQIGSLRAEMLTCFDRLAKTIREEQLEASPAKQQGFALSFPQLVTIAAAMFAAGALLAPVLGRLPMVGQ